MAQLNRSQDLGGSDLPRVRGFIPHLWKIGKCLFSALVKDDFLVGASSGHLAESYGLQGSDLPKVRGFTLIELLIVIAILAVLAAAVVLVLNPAELIRQGRDTTRISDIASVNNAIALYMADVAAYAGIGGADNAACTSAIARCTAGTSEPFGGDQSISSCTVNASTTVDGIGWVAVDLLNISSGSPLSRLPIDPVNNNSYFYAYACNGTATSTNWELDANMESNKYSVNASSSVELNTRDGGDNDSWHEIGTKLNM